MPACYPFTDQVKYSVAWTGGGTTTAASKTAGTSVAMSAVPRSLSGKSNAPADSSASSTCSLPAGCQNDPLKNYALKLVWPTAGMYSLTVTASGDTHLQSSGGTGRQFKPPPTTTVNVTVK